MSKKAKLFLAGGIILFIVLVVGGAIFFIKDQQHKMDLEKQNFINLQRSWMQDELSNLAEEYDTQFHKLEGRKSEMNIASGMDSIADQLAMEKTRVARLQEELRNVKASDGKRIKELSNEVKTLRTLLRTYIIQIDSLHTTNQKLKKENADIRQSYQQASSEVSKLKGANQELTSKVNLARKLNATAITVTPLNKKGSATKRISRMQTLKITFTVAKNLTAEVGDKTFYVRITDPNDQLLTGEAYFPFEGKNIQASCKKTIKYTGDNLTLTLYWQVNSTLLEGSYSVQIFADGNIIGQGTFKI